MKRYGIYNTVRKCFQFRISEENPAQAKEKLVTLIGDAGNNPKFEARVIPKKGAMTNVKEPTPSK